MGKHRASELSKTGVVILILLCTRALSSYSTSFEAEREKSHFSSKQRVIGVNGGPESVVWVVQLSDLHFSVHHPQRANDFKDLVAPVLSMINPSLVLITGDLTDGKSKDLLTMKQNEDEWIEYRNIMDDVVKRSGLEKGIIYDIRGNHDNFGVPVVGGSLDFFSKYSINGQLGRKGNINSITIETADRKHLFVGVDSTMHIGLRGPTNLFGHPTDQLLNELESHLSQWDSQSTKPVTKIAFGHFPLSFSAYSYSRRSLQDVFLKQSLSAYLCGHLHTKFGKNLKRHHKAGDRTMWSNKLFQLNMHQAPSDSIKNCSFGASQVKEFWEWEMGDWRKSRVMRILAIDRGHVSYTDLDFRSGTPKTIIVPTFPLDSRFMSTSTLLHKYECQHMVPASYDTVRALVFSVLPTVSVEVKVYDLSPGFFTIVLEASMHRQGHASSRGDLYTVPWNYKAFEDPLPDRYWLQIEATDIMGRKTLSELQPFSINGLPAKISWTWKEFFVFGCQWSALYHPLFWVVLCSLILTLLIPKCLVHFLKKQYSYKNFIANMGFTNGVAWVLQELCRLNAVWFGHLAYLFYLISFPWLSGQVFADKSGRAYMTYMGWVVQSTDGNGKHEYIGHPDIIVVVLPHLVFVVLPAVLVAGGLAAEREVYREHVLSLSGKKEDGRGQEKKRSHLKRFCFSNRRWLRSILLLVCLAIFWRHAKNCRALIKAYEMNPLLQFPVYSCTVPLLLAYSIYKTGRLR